MKSILLLLLVLTLSLPTSKGGSLSDFLDKVRKVAVEGAGDSPFGEVLQRGLEVFKFDDWRERLGTVLEQKAGELSKRGMQEFEKAMNDLRVLKDNPDTKKEDLEAIIKKIQSLE